MARRKKRRYLLPVLFLISVPVIVIGGIGFFVYTSYVQQQKALLKAIEDLPPFDTEEKSKEIAKELKFDYPVPESKKSPKEVEKEVKQLVKQEVDKFYSAKELSQKTLQIIKKYSTAKRDQKISFAITGGAKAGGRKVNGIYKGKKEGSGLGGSSGGAWIMVDNGLRIEKINFRNIDPEFYYLFYEKDSKKTQDEKLEEMKKEFHEKKEEYAAKMKTKIESKLYPEYGYSKDYKGQWHSNYEALQLKLDKKRKEFDKNQDKKITELKERYKLWGLIPVFVEDKKNESTDTAKNE
jgi:hypothetical protein